MFPNSPRLAFESWIGVKGTKEQKKCWISWFYVVTWSIWETRNKIIFQQQRMSFDSFLANLIRRGDLWVKDWRRFILNIPTISPPSGFTFVQNWSGSSKATHSLLGSCQPCIGVKYPVLVMVRIIRVESRHGWSNNHNVFCVMWQWRICTFILYPWFLIESLAYLLQLAGCFLGCVVIAGCCNSSSIDGNWDEWLEYKKNKIKFKI